MEDRSYRRMRTLVTQMAIRGRSANKTTRALISMMARSTTCSNQKPDTLMQDRTSARSTKPSCNARPDHTLGSFSSDQPAPDALGMSASLRSRPNLRTAAKDAKCHTCTIGDLSRCSNHRQVAGLRRRGRNRQRMSPRYRPLRAAGWCGRGRGVSIRSMAAFKSAVPESRRRHISGSLAGCSRLAAVNKVLRPPPPSRAALS